LPSGTGSRMASPSSRMTHAISSRAAVTSSAEASPRRVTWARSSSSGSRSRQAYSSVLSR
jgi:hypothetical protein